MHCALTVSAFVSIEAVIARNKPVALAFQPAISPGKVSEEDGYNMDSHAIVTWRCEIFSIQAYRHLLTVMSSIITCKLNP